jgi:hypothetical protein
MGGSTGRSSLLFLLGLASCGGGTVQGSATPGALAPVVAGMAGSTVVTDPPGTSAVPLRAPPAEDPGPGWLGG